MKSRWFDHFLWPSVDYIWLPLWTICTNRSYVAFFHLHKSHDAHLPDSLPSVKKWKSYAKEIELLKRATAKKDAKKIQATYKDAEEKLDAYLEAVELPSGMELKQM